MKGVQESTFKLAWDISGFIAVIVGASFLQGYISYNCYLMAVGVEWYSYSVPSSSYALKAIEPFFIMAPFVLLTYVMLMPIHSERKLRLWYLFSNALIFVYFGGWIYFQYRRTEGLVEVLKQEIIFNSVMLMLFGVVVATYCCFLRKSYKSKPVMVMGLSSALFIALVLIPKTLGYAKGLTVFNTSGSTLSYVMIGDERWSVLDYQKGNSLLIRYTSKKRPDSKFAKIEGLVIKNDSKLSYLGQKIDYEH
ncbi:hypothetical protein NF673_09415 [Pseudomonas moraviensis]|uniref:hypothetical protein n=1 Tax=Pseudomonas moraviensis TaxID=321662 RepID=UPI00209210C1|nr:hypothetical protein [Pseudomonas moraviensis]UST65948.1 hypothetical protein NF673_09415 [Pseudomonas moraviensis]